MSPFIFISSQLDGAYDAAECANGTDIFSSSAEPLSEYWVC